MVVQLPDGALATAAGVQIYSYICLICSALMILLVFKHRGKDSYVALLAYAAFFSTTAGIVQQLRTIVLWDDVKTSQFHYVRRHAGSPELALAGPSCGPDLVLFYIQYYCYNIESILTLVWAFDLAFSIFDPTEQGRHRRNGQKYAVIAKAASVLLPGFIVGLLQIPAVKHSTGLFLTLAEISWAASLTLGSVLLVAILTKYIRTRRKLHRSSARYHLPRGSTASSGTAGPGSESDDGIYDKWLILRFTIALLFIEVFQILTIISEISKLNDSRTENLRAEPDTSAARARGDLSEFLPGVSIGLLVFLVFGTTKACRHTLYLLFIPRAFRRGPTASTHASLPPSFPELERRPSTFITSPATVCISGPTPPPEPTRSPLGAARASPFPGPQQRMARPRPYRSPPPSRTPEIFEGRGNDDNDDDYGGIDACSFSSSADASGFGSQREPEMMAGLSPPRAVYSRAEDIRRGGLGQNRWQVMNGCYLADSD